MSLLSNPDKELPTGGSVNGVCVDVEDLGVRSFSYGPKHQVKYIWELEEQNSNGNPFKVHRTYTFSTHEMSALGKDLRKWLGRGLTEEESTMGFLRSLIGQSALLGLSEKYSQGSRFSDVVSVLPATKIVIPSGTYRSAADRAKLQEAA